MVQEEQRKADSLGGQLQRAGVQGSAVDGEGSPLSCRGICKIVRCRLAARGRRRLRNGVAPCSRRQNRRISAAAARRLGGRGVKRRWPEQVMMSRAGRPGGCGIGPLNIDSASAPADRMQQPRAATWPASHRRRHGRLPASIGVVGEPSRVPRWVIISWRGHRVPATVPGTQPGLARTPSSSPRYRKHRAEAARATG